MALETARKTLYYQNLAKRNIEQEYESKSLYDFPQQVRDKLIYEFQFWNNPYGAVVRRGQEILMTVTARASKPLLTRLIQEGYLSKLGNITDDTMADFFETHGHWVINNPHVGVDIALFDLHKLKLDKFAVKTTRSGLRFEPDNVFKKTVPVNELFTGQPLFNNAPVPQTKWPKMQSTQSTPKKPGSTP